VLSQLCEDPDYTYQQFSDNVPQEQSSLSFSQSALLWNWFHVNYTFSILQIASKSCKACRWNDGR